MKKLNFILSENKKRYEVLNKNLSDFFKIRKIEKNSTQNYETFIIIENNSKIRKKILNILSKNDFGTRNLPDAIKWHCSYFWKRAVGKKGVKNSLSTNKLLKTCIAIQIWLSKDLKDYQKLSDLISKLKKY